MTFLLLQFHIPAIFFCSHRFAFLQRETITNNLIRFDHIFNTDRITVADMVHLPTQTVLVLTPLLKNSTLSGEKNCMKIGSHYPDH